MTYWDSVGVISNLLRGNMYGIIAQEARYIVNQYAWYAEFNKLQIVQGPSWINNYLCNQCLSPLKLWVQIPLMKRCTRYNIMC